ncbi:predicted protein [Naegleria gruberi]|uniref:Predicted protein n=1 Tax=Naegleria gruberi TaxID=5762 RepID=D2W5W7_NAEGR|nr:uncharacterized protein NAEGRDRAFT_76811 [Naegleria gruberi]EFC35536.1 predicted protein [Naegleria gruberi]|eukprot:XP_002668280.1 predicted protein [Naegleria gruberi strain NEG-M]
MPQEKQLTTGQNFLFGGLSGCLATVIIQPTDFLKTRMQLLGEGQGKGSSNFVQVATSIAKNEGISTFYKGLSAALFRQVTYTTTRLGVFNTLMDFLSNKNNKSQPNFATKLGCGMIAGGIGAIVGTPADLSLIRMTSGRYNYSNIFDALYKISKNEGILNLWRGCSPTVIRAIVLNAAQLGVYAQAKQSLLSSQLIANDGLLLHISASLIAGYVCTVVSIPVDLAKTRLQSMQKSSNSIQYTGSIDVITKTIKHEGLFSLWKGFWPYFFRLGPQTIFTFLFLEQFKNHFGH